MPTVTQGCCLSPHLLTASGRYASRSEAVLGCPPTGTPGRLPVCSAAPHAGSRGSGAPPLQERTGKALPSQKAHKHRVQCSPPPSEMLLATRAAACCVSVAWERPLNQRSHSHYMFRIFAITQFVKMNTHCFCNQKQVFIFPVLHIYFYF